jgi:hypothetical protein
VSEEQAYPESTLDRQGTSESFLARFHRLKTEARRTETGSEPTASTQPIDGAALSDQTSAVPEPAQPELSDADMPPIETLDAESDYTGFLSPGVSDALRQAALRKLFHGATFNVIDGLDDYAEDFTTFEALGGVITADMKHRIQIEAEQQAEALRQKMLADTAHAQADTTEVDAADSSASKTLADEPADLAPIPDPDSETPNA